MKRQRAEEEAGNRHPARAVFETSPIRRSASDMEALRAIILEVADKIRESRTITLRQLYYALTVRGVLEKTEPAYKRLAPARAREAAA